MTGYIMEGPTEPERIRRKTSVILTGHHLDWAGLRPGDSFVDFGCATGEVVTAAAGLTDPGLVVGVDADPRMLEMAADSAASAGRDNVRFCRARLEGPDSTPLRTDAFDHAWSRFLLEYLPDRVAAIREMQRVVRPGGKVTLIDIEGNCVWHYPLPPTLRARLAEVVQDLAETGFDPWVGARLATYARDAGLAEIREAIEPYHAIVGRPDEVIAENWTRKLKGIRQAYVERLYPRKPEAGDIFDELLEFVLREDTMTWSVLHLVQGTKPR